MMASMTFHFRDNCKLERIKNRFNLFMDVHDGVIIFTK